MLHVHLVFVTKYRHGVLNADMLLSREDAMRKVCGDFGAGPREFNGEDDHAHLLAGYPPKVAVPVLVNSLNGGAGATAAIAVHWPREPAHHARALLVPSYFAASCGGAPLSITRQYIEQQRTPG